MNRGRFAAAVTAGIAFLALGLGLGLGLGLTGPAAAGTGPAARTPASPAGRTVVIDCQGKGVAKPGNYTLACADYNDYLGKLTWTSWTRKLASGYGTEWLNDCLPDCAAGHFHAYPVLVVFWGGGAVKGHPGERRYTAMTLVYTGSRPRVFNGRDWVLAPVTRTETL